ncbi:MAG: 5-dehydro-2-deoxygluconokinase, partial [Verrucomicrobia bacterium RIFCSPHIGHO2_12_FULL_41_10]
MTQFPFDNQRPIDLICMGRVAVDLYAEQIYSPLSKAQTFRCYLGGCAGNIAVGTSRQGLQSAMFSCIGQDEMGKFLLNTLRKENVDTTLLRQTPHHLTGLVILGVNPPDEFPLLFYRENCADMQITAEDCDPSFFKKAKALLITGTGFSTESMRKTSHHAIDLAKPCGTAVIMDLDYRPVLWGLAEKGEGEQRYHASPTVTAHYQKILPHCDLIVGTEEEIFIASGSDHLQTALQTIRQLTHATIVLKRGEKGCEIYEKDLNQPITGKSYPIQILNVLGAGDAFMSGLLRGWLRKEPWETCAEYANACGAIVVTRHGCASAIPNFEEMQYFISHYNKDQNILSSRAIKRLHSYSTVGNPAKETLFILAYDHRWQFEKSAMDAGKSISLIKK